jgi:hypothetical protein
MIGKEAIAEGRTHRDARGGILSISGMPTMPLSSRRTFLLPLKRMKNSSDRSDSLGPVVGTVLSGKR